MELDLKISRILHAGYVFECDGTRILFDPIFENPFSRNCYAFPRVKFDHEKIKSLQFSAIFISHFHDDHCSFASLNFLDRKTPIYIYCVFEELFFLIKELGFTNVHSLEINKTIDIQGFQIIPRRALDADVDSIFHIKVAGLNVLNVVDSWIDDSTLTALAQAGPWDMVLWPFQTMREIEVLSPSRATPVIQKLPIEWIQQLKSLNPRYVVPSSCQFIQESWSWYNHSFFPISYKQFKKEIEQEIATAIVLRLNPSVSVVLNKSSLGAADPLSWIQPLGEQNVDYEYRSDLKVPSTAEIAEHFEALKEHQSEIVFKYCRSGLLEKYQSLPTSEESYFKTKRLWRLSIFDHLGIARDFFFNIEDKTIEMSSQQDGPLAWTTEVPICKLYEALEHGESLSSMYLRINDVLFDSDIEKEIVDIDIIEDPLVRCLFTGHFGAYQIAQLKQIKESVI